MDRDLVLSIILPVAPAKAFHDWLDSAAHTAFTGSPAKIDPLIGGKFSTGDGYIWGRTLDFSEYSRIRQSWRTSDFPESAPDSILEILFEPQGKGTRLTLIHTNIPEYQADEYEKGWQEYYFKPMKEYYHAGR